MEKNEEIKKEKDDEIKEEKKEEKKVTDKKGEEQTKKKKSSKKDEKIESLEEKISAQKDKFLRIAAEYENFRKRSEKEKLSIYSNGASDTIEALLPVVDSLELAVKSSQNAPDEYKKGLELMQNQVATCFEKLGVVPTGEVGQPFDPNYHNAVAHVEDSDEEENIIVDVFQKGYLLKDKVIRYAMVKVAN